MPAPLGNQNASKAKIWNAAIHRALERRTKRREDGLLEIDALAEKLLEAVAEGDLPALREFGDRIDGKSVQAIEGSVGLTGSLSALVDLTGLSDAEIAAGRALLEKAVGKASA